MAPELAAIARRIAVPLTGWRDALAGLSENPLLRYWQLAENRRGGRGRLRRAAAPLLALVATAAGVGYLMARGLWDSSDLDQAPLILALACALPTYLVWLLLRVHSAAQVGLSFLARGGRGRFEQRVDEMVLLSGLSEQEILLGGVALIMRILWPPLLGGSILLLTALGGLIALGRDELRTAYLPAMQGQLHDPVLLNFTAAAPWLLLKLLLGGTLAALLLAFQWIGLSLARRSGILPSICGSLHALLQLVLIPVGVWLSVDFIRGSYYYYDIWDVNATADNSGSVIVSALLLSFLAFYLARRSEILRAALASGVMLPLCYGFVNVLSLGGLNSFDYTFERISMGALWLSSSTVLLNPIAAEWGYWLLLGQGLNFDAADSPLTAVWSHGRLLLFQLGLLVIAAELARDAIRRRKWDALSDVYRRGK